MSKSHQWWMWLLVIVLSPLVIEVEQLRADFLALLDRLAPPRAPTE
jgi:hypothetical protein